MTELDHLSALDRRLMGWIMSQELDRQRPLWEMRPARHHHEIDTLRTLAPVAQRHSKRTAAPSTRS